MQVIREVLSTEATHYKLLISQHFSQLLQGIKKFYKALETNKRVLFQFSKSKKEIKKNRPF